MEEEGKAILIKRELPGNPPLPLNKEPPKDPIGNRP